ncbi:hypothetical protein L1987_43489 [Smallanthus sonchifolius]|uniref:Uncharacterized protein n=1 Tax=Smallanthus sonchifolius TaxID=185202 RepID=A0ACB9GMR2_9ASTR|nr:hypothetical protein L1987_43489 [Smallanthus sonchifolius]
MIVHWSLQSTSMVAVTMLADCDCTVPDNEDDEIDFIVDEIDVLDFVMDDVEGDGGGHEVVDDYDVESQNTKDLLIHCMFGDLIFIMEIPMLALQVGKLDDAKEVTFNMWGPSKAKRSIEEFQSVLKNDGVELSIGRNF